MASSSATSRVSSETSQKPYTIFDNPQVRNSAPFDSERRAWFIPFVHAPAPRSAKMHCLPVTLYDQLGTGDSTHVYYKPGNFFTLVLFVAELETLIRHLCIEGDLTSSGSPGAALAIEYNAPDAGVQAHRKALFSTYYGRLRRQTCASSGPRTSST